MTTTPPPRQQQPRPPRQGPRPLALHLAMSAGALISSPLGLPFLSGGSPIWKGAALTARAQRLHADLAAALLAAAPAASDPASDDGAARAETARADWVAAVEREARHRLDRLLTGLERYRRSPHRRDIQDPPAVWGRGNSRLLAYADSGIPVLFVPSLVNRGYILDLSARRSLLRWLADRGFRPFLLDWGAVGPVERGYHLDDYVSQRLMGAVAAIRTLVPDRRPALVGYCMGGTLAVAAAQALGDQVTALALLAAPWDFHADDAAAARRTAACLPLLEPALTLLGELPVDLLQSLFAGIAPQLALQKFTHFASLHPDGEEAASFVMLEDWLNDGLPLAAPVARACLEGWYGRNDPGLGRWRVGGRVVDPAALRLPTLAVIPARDRIVPPGSATALIDAIPGGVRLTPALGHIGMIVSGAAPAAVWEPLADWLGMSAG